MISTYSGGDQWIRRWSLAVYTTTSGGAALELSAGVGQAGSNSGAGFSSTTGPQGQILSEGLRIKFRTVSLDNGVPNHAEITIYNLKAETAARVMNHEFSRVVLQAGYDTGKYGIIFSGTIKQTKRGRESATDTYIIIYASDADFYLTQYAIQDPIYMERSSAAVDRAKAIQDDAVKNGGVQAGPIQGLEKTGGILPRGKTIVGMANKELDTTSRPFAQWSIQNGKLQMRPIKGYLDGEAVVLNAQSGLVGMPETYNQGVFVTALLNPAIKVGGRIKINNGDINTSEPAVATRLVQEQGFPAIGEVSFFAAAAADGTYVVIGIEYEGDTRANPWYVKIMCLLLDASSGEIAPGQPATNAFTPVGGPTSPGHL